MFGYWYPAQCAIQLTIVYSYITPIISINYFIKGKVCLPGVHDVRHSFCTQLLRKKLVYCYLNTKVLLIAKIDFFCN